MYSAKIDLIANIIRDNSPPEADFLSSLKLEPLFAINKNCKLSFPFLTK